MRNKANWIVWGTCLAVLTLAGRVSYSTYLEPHFYNSISGVTAHPVHVTVTELEFFEGTGTFQVAHKLFVDDLEMAIEKHYGTQLNLFSEEEAPNADSLIQVYLNSTFALDTLNAGKGIPLGWVGKEAGEDRSVWVYRESEKIDSLPDGIFLRNEIFFKIYPDQTNFLNYTAPAFEKSLRFYDRKPSAYFTKSIR